MTDEVVDGIDLTHVTCVITGATTGLERELARAPAAAAAVTPNARPSSSTRSTWVERAGCGMCPRRFTSGTNEIPAARELQFNTRPGKEDHPMPNRRNAAVAALGTAMSLLALPTLLTIAPAHGAPPACPAPASVADNVCTARLTSVTADTVNGTITGTPVGGGAPLTLSGTADAYLKSQGFGAAPPDPVQQWDAAIDRVNNADMNGPDWYGNAKSRVFLPRSLDELASQFPPNTIVVRFALGDTNSGSLPLVSIQPIAQ
jgi:hypothetical protein